MQYNVLGYYKYSTPTKSPIIAKKLHIPIAPLKIPMVYEKAIMRYYLIVVSLL